MIRLAFAFVFCASLVGAQTLPERFMVSGVAADDVLNIRSGPDASSDIIDTFGPYVLNVEVLRTLDGWGQVPTPEGFGWVSMRYLAENPIPTDSTPRPLVCSGTEPFWTFAMYPRGAQYRALGGYGDTLRQLKILSENVAPNGFLVTAQDGPERTHTLMVDGRACNDGMSDRPFGMSATLFIAGPDGNYVQTGCCTMQSN